MPTGYVRCLVLLDYYSEKDILMKDLVSQTYHCTVLQVATFCSPKCAQRIRERHECVNPKYTATKS